MTLTSRAGPPLFPFGRPAHPQGPRRPRREAKAFVLGVYPSALHVRWTYPAWYVPDAGMENGENEERHVSALAVADEPVVFWDGQDPHEHECVAQWMRLVEFREGDGPGEWGQVAPAGNGTSGRPVISDVLEPLGLDTPDVWFTDIVNTYFVKGPVQERTQLRAMKRKYEPFALAAHGLASATIPERPSPPDLVHLAIHEHRERLRAQFVEAAAPLLVTLGEEARQTVIAIADEVHGTPQVPLVASRFAADPTLYGKRGKVRIDGTTVDWYALVHPGQRKPAWNELRAVWLAGLTSR